LHAGVLWQQQPPVLHVENVRFSGQNFQIVGELFYYPQGASERVRGRGGAENDPEHATKRTGAAIGSEWTWFWVVSTAGSVREPDSALCYRIVNPVRLRGRRHGSPRGSSTNYCCSAVVFDRNGSWATLFEKWGPRRSPNSSGGHGRKTRFRRENWRLFGACACSER